MTQTLQEVVAPHTLRATAAHRTDGDVTLYGIQLGWTIGANSGADWPPPADWNSGDAPYPRQYEVWLSGGQIRQTVSLNWPRQSEGWGWQFARTHWVCLGTHPYHQYQVKIRAKLSDGSWSDFTNEVTVQTSNSSRYVSPIRWAQSNVPSRRPRHGTVGSPASRSARAIRDNDPAEICQRARELNTSTTWQEVIPPVEVMKADPPWNGSYLEYRKFFRGGDLASAANPAFAGLDLVGDWPTARLQASATEYTFTYDYTAHHVGDTWTHQWFVTKDDWDPTSPLTWDQFEPTPFMPDTYDDAAVTEYTTEALPPKTGRHIIVNIWGGWGGPIDDNGRMTGEFFVSCSDVEFTDNATA